MKRVLIVSDGHFLKTSDGKVWSQSVYDYAFYKRYVGIFEKVFIAIRIKETDTCNHDGYPLLCSGEGVDFLGITDFLGPKGYIKNFFKVTGQLKKYEKFYDCAIIRCPSIMYIQYCTHVIFEKKPWALEIVNDPWIYRDNIVLKLLLTCTQKLFCKKANGVAYVSKYTLQKRYPCRAQIVSSERYFTSSYSSVVLNKEDFFAPKEYRQKEKYTLCHVANAIKGLNKGHIEAIEVVKRLNADGINCDIDFVGSGDYVEKFTEYAKTIGIEKRVHFIGKIADKELLFRKINSADLFLFPTHGEGLPRVLLESMATGTVCVSTKIGSIVEILDEDQMAEKGDIEGYYRAVRRLLDNPKRMTELSIRGIEIANEFRDDVLKLKRDEFYKRLWNLC